MSGSHQGTSDTGIDLPIYPPADHILRDIPFVVEHRTAEDGMIAHRTRQPLHGLNTVRSADRAASSGNDWDHIDVGSWSTVVDLGAGSLCGITIAPDWMATSSLSLHRYSNSRSRADRVDTQSSTSDDTAEFELINDIRIVRDGRTSITLSVDASVVAIGIDTPAQPFGTGIVHFTRLSRPVEDLDISRLRSDPTAHVEFERQLATPAPQILAKALALEVIDAHQGVIELAMSSYVRNSFGAVNGGVLSSCAVIAARVVTVAESLTIGDHATDALQRLSQPSGVVTGVEVHYLAQARVGPFRTRLRHHDDDTASSNRSPRVIEIHDFGRLDSNRMPTLVALAFVQVQ